MSKKSDGAVLREVNGQLVLDDPVAVAVIRAVARANCVTSLRDHHERIEHFQRRVSELGLSPQEVIIVVINVDDRLGGPLADALMPNTNRAAFRARGEIPYALGLAERAGIEATFGLLDPEIVTRLTAIPGLAIVVVDYGVVAVFDMNEAARFMA